MPEGDTIFRTATVLRRALEGRVVTALELVAPKVTAAAARRRVEGGTVKAVASNGKHLLITFTTDGDDDVVLHTHMKMSGEWHVYRAGERWWRTPEPDARVVVRTAEYVAPCFHPPVVELLTARELAIHPLLSALGPDILSEAFDAGEAARRLRANPRRDIATALLDQRSLSGVGNVFKCEALFLERVSPWTRAADLDDDALRRLLLRCRTLMRANLDGGPRRTLRSLDRRESTWVDERTGLPCRVCATPIAWGWHPDEVRKSWYCPRCQPLPTGVIPPGGAGVLPSDRVPKHQDAAPR